MFFYELGYTSPEDSASIMLVHDKQFTKEEYEDLVFNCSVEAAIAYYKDKAKDYAEYRADHDDEDENDKYYWDDRCIRVSFDSLYDKVADKLVEEHGFSYLKVEQCIRPYGWDNLRNRDDWQCYNDEFTERLGEKVIEATGEYVDWSVIRKENQNDQCG